MRVRAALIRPGKRFRKIMLRVAVLFEFASLNGGERSLLAVIDSLLETSAVQFSALAPDFGPLADELRARLVPLSPLPMQESDEAGRPVVDFAAVMRKCVDDNCCDVLHANSLTMARKLGRYLKTPKAVGVRSGGEPTRLSGPIGRLRISGHVRDIMRLNASSIDSLNCLDRIISVSHATREGLLSQGVDPNRCVVIHNGISADSFVCRTNHRVCRQREFPQIPESAFLILCVGQICLRKGQLDVARACVQAMQSNHELHLVIVGARYSEKPESREYDREITRLFENAGMMSRLHRTGVRNNISELMAGADLLVSAARQEPFGRTLLEAAVCRLPVVTTNVGGTAEMFRRDVDAIFVAPGDSAQLCEAILKLVTDKPLRRRLAESANERVCCEFTAAASAQKLLRCWQEICEEK